MLEGQPVLQIHLWGLTDELQESMYLVCAQDVGVALIGIQQCDDIAMLLIVVCPSMQTTLGHSKDVADFLWSISIL
jgi:hypothetical protein